jgi:hypothetical protein
MVKIIQLGRAFRQIRMEDLYFAVPFIGAILFHLLLWEAKAQYAITFFIFLVPYAAAGIVSSEKWIHKIILLFVHKSHCQQPKQKH